MMTRATTSMQEQVMRAVQANPRDAGTGPLDAATLGGSLGRSTTEVARMLRRCAREGLVTLHEYVGLDNPTVVRLTYLGETWLERRAGPPPMAHDDAHPAA